MSKTKTKSDPSGKHEGKSSVFKHVMDKESLRAVGQTVDILIASGARRAVKYIDPKWIVRATARLERGKLSKDRFNYEMVLHIGRPNHRERLFIKTLKKAQEPFPVKQVVVQFPPKKKGS